MTTTTQEQEPVVLNDATPERIAKAANDNTVDESGVRRFADSVVQRLAARNGLYPDTVINGRLKEAAERYYADWYNGGLSGIQAIDYSKVTGGGGGDSTYGMPASMRQAQARGAYRKARLALGAKYRPVVESIVIQEQSDLVAIGRKASGMASEAVCRAIATERLTAGLYLLAQHYETL